MDEKKTCRMEVRLTLKEKNELLLKAKMHGKTVAQYIREAIINDKIIAKTDIQTVLQLKHIGNNLNQIAKHLNTISHEDNIKHHLKEIDIFLNDLSLICKNLL